MSHWVTYVSPVDGRERAGLLVGDEVRGFDAALVDLLGDLPAAAAALPVETVARTDVTLRAPIPRPPSVRDFLAFEEHLRNALAGLGRTDVPDVWFDQPVFYFSNPAAIRGPGQDVPIAPGSSRYDYEVEVAAVVGKAGSDLTPEQAESHIAGYTILCDFSARDLQATESPVGLGPTKGKDTATGLGPWLVTPDELADVRAGNGFDLRMRAVVNGREYGGGSWSTIRWSFGQMLAYASRGTELRPGDVIGSGTVGTGCLLELSHLHGSEAYPWLQPGDEVSIEVERLGALTARIVPGPAVVPLT
ncbi:fumarylacetoacetate hydrolase family protein [Actinomycetospora chiangmaiensis]|uniref:fumarylacetoacetate hydrolase family protein n=1 Tax=Actinomycetospora chiangmaiensis TaxID=402650 RepID=UPI000368AF7F|nr:fumarylacetoacetate hydrolase family protein [Actinomycetospora chiangmaiensis]